MKALFQGGPKHGVQMELRDRLGGRPALEHYFAEIQPFQYPVDEADLLSLVPLTRLVYRLHHVEPHPGGDIAVYGFRGREA